MKDGASAFRKMEYVDRSTIGNISKEQGSIEQRAEKMKEVVEREIERHEEAKKYIPRAEELLSEYGSPDNIPQEELERDLGKLDDGKLLAYTRILEEREKARKSKLH